MALLQDNSNEPTPQPWATGYCSSSHPLPILSSSPHVVDNIAAMADWTRADKQQPLRFYTRHYACRILRIYLDLGPAPNYTSYVPRWLNVTLQQQPFYSLFPGKNQGKPVPKMIRHTKPHYHHYPFSTTDLVFSVYCRPMHIFLIYLHTFYIPLNYLHPINQSNQSLSTFINSARVTQCHNGAGWWQRLSSAHQMCL